MARNSTISYCARIGAAGEVLEKEEGKWGSGLMRGGDGLLRFQFCRFRFCKTGLEVDLEGGRLKT